MENINKKIKNIILIFFKITPFKTENK